MEFDSGLAKVATQPSVSSLFAKLQILAASVALFSLPTSVDGQESSGKASGGFSQPDVEAFPNLFSWTDTCNVYVIRDGKAAILIDFGNGDVMDHLSEIGVENVEWVLLTHHHREQCQGIYRLDRSTTKVAVPETERELFEKPLEFRKWNPALRDPFSVFGASYVRPPILPVPIDRGLKPNENFDWHGHEVLCIDTPGHSPGGMTYLLYGDDKNAAFSGDLIHDGSRMVTWFDSEWDYGFGKGIDALIDSAKLLSEQPIDLALPSHGPTIQKPRSQLETYYKRLETFRGNFVRGYETGTRIRDAISKETDLPLINQVTPHLFKLNREYAGKNFAIIISDNGRGLILDSGLFPELILHRVLNGLQEHFGLKEVDALWISHMHGDHFLHAQFLKEFFDVELWTLDMIADKCENPRNYDYAAPISAYPAGFDGIPIDKSFRDGETIEWEGYKIQVDWMPGQTEFGCCLWLEMDGKRIAFTGDNIFADPTDEKEDGHEAVMARNSSIFEEGYLHAARYLRELQPDLIMGSHSYVMDDPAGLIERYNDWAERMIQQYEELLPDREYEYLFDPYWVSAYPYRVDFTKQGTQTVNITVRNFRDTPQRHRVKLKLPPGLHAEPAVLEGEVEPESRATYPVKLTADHDAFSPGVHMVGLDIRLDDTWYGELFDFVFQVRPQ